MRLTSIIQSWPGCHTHSHFRYPQITATLNPGCPDTLCNTQAAAETGDQPQLITVVHVRAAGQTDDIHHVWDFTGKPSVLVARTVPHANLTINWRLFMDNVPNSVRFDVVPMYTTCLVLDRVSNISINHLWHTIMTR